MSNIHTQINEEVEVTLKLKVKFTNASYYDQLSNEQLRERIDEAKSKIKNELLNMVEDEFYQQELSSMVLFDYEVTNIETPTE